MMRSKSDSAGSSLGVAEAAASAAQPIPAQPGSNLKAPISGYHSCGNGNAAPRIDAHRGDRSGLEAAPNCRNTGLITARRNSAVATSPDLPQPSREPTVPQQGATPPTTDKESAAAAAAAAAVAETAAAVAALPLPAGIQGDDELGRGKVPEHGPGRSSPPAVVVSTPPPPPPPRPSSSSPPPPPPPRPQQRSPHEQHQQLLLRALCRSRVLGWMTDVFEALGMLPSTLATARTLLERFAMTPEVLLPPEGLLQLLALACMSVAVKQDEVKPVGPTVCWLDLAVDETGRRLYEARDLERMEELLRNTLAS